MSQCPRHSADRSVCRDTARRVRRDGRAESHAGTVTRAYRYAHI